MPHEGPCYRDPKTSSPNFIYVRVRNRGSAASSGTETLHVYWAKASTGLTWPGDWNDHLASPCGGPPRLYGYEVTKPRKNAASATVAERNAYVAAVQAINAAPFLFPDGSTYFGKQDTVHAMLFGTGIHNSLRFLPWHREFMARYETLLREVSPALTLLYWDWTTDPSVAINYMGIYNGVVGAPFAGFGTNRNKVAGAPGVTRPGLTPGYQSGTLLPSASYAALWGNIEVSSHNAAHTYLGGMVGSANAARDPLFFMLHANCDRIWALWQRQNVNRWTPSIAYDASQANAAITSAMRPWNGADGFSPWLNQIPGDPDGYVVFKAPTSHSLVYPPIYDDAPLRVPVLNPGQCCIIEVPFYPPPYVECGGFSDPQHLCLLARIQPVSVAEVASVWDNVKNNNNIAWKNVALSDCNVGPFFALSQRRVGAAGELVTNTGTAAAIKTLRFNETVTGFQSLFNFGRVRVRLEANLFDAWVRGGRRGTGIEAVGGTNEFIITGPGATIAGMPLQSGEMGRVDVALELNNGYAHPNGDIYHLEMLQFNGEQAVNPEGGQRFDLDFNVLPIVRKGSDWKYLDAGAVPPANWMLPTYDDKTWKTGTATFGYRRTDVATGLVGSGTQGAAPTAYFRQTFSVQDPALFQTLGLNLLLDDGLVVYLNGTEMTRQNMPVGEITPNTFALGIVEGAKSRAYRSLDVTPWSNLLVPGLNVIAVEVHGALPIKPIDLTFDLELAGNPPPFPYQPPNVLIVAPENGGMVKTNTAVQISADVFDPDNDLQQVRILYDGAIVSTLTAPPFSATVSSGSAGRVRRVSVLAQDGFGHVTRAESVFSVVTNLPPSVAITRPLMETFASDAPVVLDAAASDADGSVTRVAFFVKDHSTFGSPILAVGTSSTPPYSVTVTNLAPGMYLATAQATDNGGAIGYSLPGHFLVEKPVGAQPLGVRLERFGTSQVLALDWVSHSAVLEHNSDLLTGNWQPIPDALSPYLFNITEASGFFRLSTPHGNGKHCGCGGPTGTCTCVNCTCNH